VNRTRIHDQERLRSLLVYDNVFSPDQFYRGSPANIGRPSSGMWGGKSQKKGEPVEENRESMKYGTRLDG